MEFVHARLVAERDRGTAVLLVSSELDEIRGLADRIVVLCGGRVTGQLAAGASAADCGVLMGGGILPVSGTAAAVPAGTAGAGAAAAAPVHT